MLKEHTELDVWKLADELRDLIIAFTGKEPAARDRKFCDQIRGSIDSACANTAEGFGRYAPAEFRQFLRVARGSLLETQDHLRSAQKRQFITEQDCEVMSELARRAAAANARLQTYLRSKQAKRNASAP